MRTLSFMSLMLLAACNGGDPGDTSNTSGDGGTDGGGTITPGMAAIKVTAASFLGASDDCDIVVNNEKAGEVGQQIEVEADRTHWVGVGTVNEDGLITHTLSDTWAGDSTWAGATVIVPEWDVELADGAVDEREVEFNLYVEGSWTCNFVDGEESTAQTGSVSYPTGETMRMPVGTLGVNGIDIYSTDAACNRLEGEFLNPTQLVFYMSCAKGDDANFECWEGSFEERPSAW